MAHATIQTNAKYNSKQDYSTYVLNSKKHRDLAMNSISEIDFSFKLIKKRKGN
jgi:hypothetical protein